MGRWSRERHAQEAAKKANVSAQAMPQATPKAAPSTPEGQTEPASTEGTRPPPRNEPRRKAMEEIEAREQRTSGLTPEPEKVEPTPEPVRPTPEAILAADAKAAASAAEPAEPTEPVKEVIPEPVKMVKVKVDGEEFEVTQAEIDEAGSVTAFQKERAADNRLKKTNEMLAETRRSQAALTQYIQNQTPKQPDITDDQFIQSKMDAIRFGTPEEYTVAMKEVSARLSPRIDENIMTQRAVSVMQMNNALDNFKKEFQDVMANPMLRRLAVSLERERMSEITPQTDWQEFYRKIGNEVRSVVGRPSQPTPPALVTPTGDTPSPQSDKEARKASIVNLPTAAARATTPADPKPETREDILNSMRKTRGIPTG